MLSQLDDLYFFGQIVRAGSLTKAAADLGVPKSKLSRRLSAFERKVGSPLLIRTTRSLALTEIGEYLFQQAEPHLLALSSLDEDISVLMNQATGCLRLLMPQEFFNQLFSELLVEFAEIYPNISLFCNHYSQAVPDDFSNADVVFVLHETPLAPSSWVGKTLMSFPQSIFASLLLNNDDINKPSDLSEHHCILNSAEKSWLFRHDTGVEMVPIQGRVTMTSPEMRLQAAAKNLGVAKLPDFVCYVNNCGSKVKKLKLSHQPVALQLSVMFQHRIAPAKIRVFLDFFQSNLHRFGY